MSGVVDSSPKSFVEGLVPKDGDVMRFDAEKNGWVPYPLDEAKAAIGGAINSLRMRVTIPANSTAQQVSEEVLPDHVCVTRIIMSESGPGWDNATTGPTVYLLEIGAKEFRNDCPAWNFSQKVYEPAVDGQSAMLTADLGGPLKLTPDAPLDVGPMYVDMIVEYITK